MLNKYKQLIIGIIIGGMLFGLYPAFASMVQLNAEYSNIKLKLNGTYIDTGTDEPFIVNGRTYIPARYVAEAMGGVVSWDVGNNTVIIQASIDYDCLLRVNNNAIIQDPIDNEDAFVKVLIGLAQMWDTYTLDDDTFAEIENTTGALELLTDVVMYRDKSSIPQSFKNAFSEFWADEKSMQYPLVKEWLEESFTLEKDTNTNKWTIQ